MNIFYLDKDPVKAAQMAIDKHVVKMILESAQMLCTAHRVLDGQQYVTKSKTGRNVKKWKHPNAVMDNILYGAGWLTHPSTQWVMASAYNYNWLYKHFIALNDEFIKRYPKNKDGHKSIQKLKDILRNPPKNSPLNVLGTDATPAMPDECKVKGDVVQSYRNYYIMKKRDFASWKSPSVMPEWFKKGIENVTR